MKLNQLPAASLLLVALCAVSSAHAAVTVKKVTAVSATTPSVTPPTGTDTREPRHEPPTGGDRLTPLQKLLLAIWWKNHHGGPSLP